MPRSPKSALVLTGIRSEYDILYSVMRAVAAHPELELGVVVSGAHLSPRFGYTVEQIERDGFPIVERIESLLDADSGSGRVRSAAVQLLGVTQVLQRLRPDVLVVCGDREEAIVGALAGAYVDVPVAHIAGGDVAVGNVDDSVRHAVTKLAHLHFTLSEASAARVRSLGEEPWRVHACGNPALDRFRLVPRMSRAQLSQAVGVDLSQGPLLFVLQHGISSEQHDAPRQLEITLEAVASLGYVALVGSPNSDAGSRAMLDVIETCAGRQASLHPTGTLPRDVFVNLLRTVDVLVGNSSLGLLEAPFLGLPAVNVGNRQQEREHAANVVFVPHDADRIREAVKRCLTDDAWRAQLASAPQPFGDGFSGERIARVLAAMDDRERLLIKRWTR